MNSGREPLGRSSKVSVIIAVFYGARIVPRAIAGAVDAPAADDLEW